MTDSFKLIAFAGSTRLESFNKKLIREAARLGGQEGLSVTVVDLKDYPLPLYDADDEAVSGLPGHAITLKRLIAGHDAVLIASPEYNASVTAVLKNAIDWTSRSGGDMNPDKVWSEKCVGLLSASPGGLGGIRALNHLRAILLNVSAFVIPAQFALTSAHQAFGSDGHLKSDDATQAVRQVLQQLARTAQALRH